MLTFEELRQKNTTRCREGFGHELSSWSVAEWGCATAGEVGEACNLAKKLLRFRDGIKGNTDTKENIELDFAIELGDILVYLDLWAASQGISLENAVRFAFNNKSRQIGYPIEL